MKVVEKISTHCMFNNFFSITVPLIMWKNFGESGRPQMTISHMYIACLIPQATNSLSEYVICVIFHCNNGCRNTPQYYIISTLPVLLLAGYSHLLHEHNRKEIYMNHVILHTITIPTVTGISGTQPCSTSSEKK